MRRTLLLALLLLAGCGSSYVRLRGSNEIHLESCSRVGRADPDGIVPADSDDGPPCFHCRREEAVEWSRDPD